MELIKNIEEDNVVRTIQNICETKNILIRIGYFFPCTTDISYENSSRQFNKKFMKLQRIGTRFSNRIFHNVTLQVLKSKLKNKLDWFKQFSPKLRSIDVENQSNIFTRYRTCFNRRWWKETIAWLINIDDSTIHRVFSEKPSRRWNLLIPTAIFLFMR